MLKKFSVKNFKQFEEITLDFSRKRDYAFSKDCLTKDASLVKTALVYGENASGKSNLGYAIFDVVRLLTNKLTDPRAYVFFANADHPEDPVKFEFVFLLNNKEIRYSYSRDKSGKLIEEELCSEGVRVFQWSNVTNTRDFEHLSEFSLSSLNNSYYGSNTPFLRYAANNAPIGSDNPVKLVMDFVSHMLWFRRSDYGNSFMGFLETPSQIDEFIINSNLLEKFEAFLNSHGVQEKVVGAELPDGKKIIYFKHKQLIPLFDSASSGTLSLAVFFYWTNFLKDVSFLFLDEFDAFYHYKVSEQIYNFVKELEIQTILTTHNSNLLMHSSTRADCCFKIQSGIIKSMADLTNREIREGNNLEKLFLAGEFDE